MTTQRKTRTECLINDAEVLAKEVLRLLERNNDEAEDLETAAGIAVVLAGKLHDACDGFEFPLKHDFGEASRCYEDGYFVGVKGRRRTN